MQDNATKLIISEYFSLPKRSDDNELNLIEAALFAEQTFGIILEDEDISRESLGTPEAFHRIIEIKGAHR